MAPSRESVHQNDAFGAGHLVELTSYAGEYIRTERSMKDNLGPAGALPSARIKPAESRRRHFEQAETT